MPGVDETFDMLESLRELAILDKTLPAKKGPWLENTILRLSVKVALLFQRQQLTPAEFGAVRASHRPSSPPPLTVVPFSSTPPLVYWCSRF